MDSAGGQQSYGRIVQLAILPEFRGMGVGSALLRHCHQQAVQRGLRRLLIDLPAAVDYLSKNLQGLGFAIHGVCWEAELGN